MAAVTGAQLDWSVLVGVIALFTSAMLAFSSWRQSREKSRHDELMRLADEFDAAEYRMRFWRTGLAIRAACAAAAERGGKLDQSNLYLSPNPPGTRPALASWSPSVVDTHGAQRSNAFSWASGAFDVQTQEGGTVGHTIAEDLLGPTWSPYRSDLADFWMFSLRVWSWVEDGDRPFWANRLRWWTRRAANADAVSMVFGNRLVMTMVGHRNVASRMASQKTALDAPANTFQSRDYYRLHYGVSDARYARVVEALAESADRMGLLTSRHRDQIVELESRLAAESFRSTAESAAEPVRPAFTRPKGW
jgi:hypothetical protein